MKISVDKDRKVYTSSSLAGTVNENYYEVLEFTFPEELDNYTKYIEIQAEDLRYVDRIEDNKFTISNALSKYEYLQVQIVCKDLQNNIVYKSNIFTLSTNDSLNIMEDISVEQRDLLDRVELELQEAKEDIEELQETQTEHTEQIQANATDIDNLETEVANIKTKNTQQDNAINENTQDISDIKEEQTTQNNNIAGNTNRITVLEHDSGNKVALSINSDYVMTLQLLNKNNEVLSTGTIDLPIESMIVNASYSNGILTLTLQNGRTLDVDISDIVSGLVSETTFNSAISELQGSINSLTTRMTQAETNIQENTDDIEALTTKHDTEVAELQSQIEELQEENQALEDQIPTGEESGSDITLSDSARYKFKKMVLGGKSEQETFTGKNKFNRDDIYLENRLIQNTGNITVSQNFDLYRTNVEPNKTFTLSITNTSATTRDCRICAFKEDETFIQEITSFNINANSKATKTFIIPAETAYILYHILKTSDEVQLEEGSTATDYEPYTGGQPAPNPSYECPIQNVTGDVEVKVENKNLFNSNISNYTITNTGENTNGNDRLCCDYEKISGNKITFSNTSASGFIGIAFYDDNKNFISRNISSGIVASITVDIPNNAKYARAFLQLPRNEVANVETIDKYKLQLEEGPTPTDYVSHEQQTVTFPLEEGQILHEVDTIEDKIVQRRKTINLWSVDKLSTATLFGVTFKFASYSLPDAIKTNRNYRFLCDRVAPAREQYGKYKAYLNNNVFIVMTDTDDTVENFNEKIAGATLEYELETPIETEFTEAQRTAKAQIDKLYSYKGTTHITSNANLDVTYRKDIETMIDKMEELDARLSLLES